MRERESVVLCRERRELCVCERREVCERESVLRESCV